MPASRWIIGGASVIGAAHIRHNMPNQDALSFWPETLSGVPMVYGALADGHGARAHFRSDRGADLATKAAVSALEWSAGQDGDVDVNELGLTVAEGWRNKVYADIDEFPYEGNVASPLHPYGATVLGMMADHQRVLLLQLGDGDILLGYPDGRIDRPISLPEGLVGEQTYSLCMKASEQYLDTWSAHLEWGDDLPDFVMMSTDGVSKSLVSDQAFEELAAQYREQCRESIDTFSNTVKALPSWLTRLSEQGSGDDASMILAVRMDNEG